MRGSEKPEVKIIGTTNSINNLEDAKKFSQNMARVCYSEKNIEEIQTESYDSILTDKILLGNNHHSPFEHFYINFAFKRFPKAFAMTMNNQNVYVTSEKSARYTQMKDIAPQQLKLYNKWCDIFNERIKEEYSETNFPKLYSKRKDKNTGKVLPSTAEKLAQENARYVTSVFTPTYMTHTLSLRQMNIVAGFFEDFIKENEGTQDLFKQKLMQSYQQFLDSESVQKFRISGIKRKAEGKLRLFGESNEEFFGKDVYSTNINGSFAWLAQSQRHRTEYHHINNGWQLGAQWGDFLFPQ